MRNILVPLAFLVSLISCNDRVMTLEEMKKAKWIKLDKGIEYISLKNNSSATTDSIRFNMVGEWDPIVTTSVNTENEAYPEISNILTPIINERISKSQKGYIKLNFYEMMGLDSFVTVSISFTNSYDSVNLQKDMEAISKMKGVKTVDYISKEEAKQRYLDDGNDDWSHVLDANPLPNAIEIKIDKTKIKPEDYNDFENKIKLQLYYAGDFSIPTHMDKYEKKFIIIGYNRN